MNCLIGASLCVSTDVYEVKVFNKSVTYARGWFYGKLHSTVCGLSHTVNVKYHWVWIHESLAQRIMVHGLDLKQMFGNKKMYWQMQKKLNVATFYSFPKVNVYTKLV